MYIFLYYFFPLCPSLRDTMLTDTGKQATRRISYRRQLASLSTSCMMSNKTAIQILECTECY